MSTRLHLLAAEVIVGQRQVNLTYDVRFTNGEEEAVLARGATCVVNLPQNRWDQMQAALDGVIDDLSRSIGLRPMDRNAEQPLDGWGDSDSSIDDDEQEL